MTDATKPEEFLNLADIQGNVVRAYGRFSFPHARYFFLNIRDPKKGREFIDAIREKVTTAERWKKEDKKEGAEQLKQADGAEQSSSKKGNGKPRVTLNIGFTFRGLLTLDLPTRTLQSMPPEYIDGMRKRAHILGDSASRRMDGGSEKDTHDHTIGWDRIWQESHSNLDLRNNEDVHVWVSMNAQLKAPGHSDEADDALEEQTEFLRGLCDASKDGVRILATNGKNGDQEYQAATAVFKEWPDGKILPTHNEHFGFADGIGDPVFKGQYPEDDMPKAIVGRGKWMDEDKKWEALAAGEFILGYPDESQELPPTAAPPNFMNNGTFMVYRKLHENIQTFEGVIAEEAESYAKMMNIGLEEAKITLKAKMVGRWPDGVPLSTVTLKEGGEETVSDYQAWRAFRKERGFDILGQPEADTATPKDLKAARASYETYFKSEDIKNFRFSDDMEGNKCPVSSHLRRTNTRDYLDPSNPFAKPGIKANPTTQLNKRRRLLRRGLPYGPPRADQHKDDDTEQGVIFMALCGSIFRQFEFVQQQWIQYGLDFNVGNNTCPLLGNHDNHKRYTITSDPKSGKPPYIMSKLETFVETRGGDYFFIPSMTALRMMGKGIVDPT